MLMTRKFEVVFISSPLGEAPSNAGSITEEWIRLPGSWAEGAKGGDAKVLAADPETNQQSTSKPAVTEIEEIIIDKLVGMHTQWINQPAVSH